MLGTQTVLKIARVNGLALKSVAGVTTEASAAAASGASLVTIGLQVATTIVEGTLVHFLARMTIAAPASVAFAHMFSWSS